MAAELETYHRRTMGAHRLWRRRAFVPILVATVLVPVVANADPALVIAPAAWRIVARESGPVNYYSVKTEGTTTFVRSQYAPPMKTAVLGWQMPEADRKRAKALTWTWRARTFPKGADACQPGKGDAAAGTYVTWKRGLRYYTLKYVWTASGTKGQVCGRKRNLFVAQDTVLLEVGPPIDVWRKVELDLAFEFRKHFADGDAAADVPDFVGVGIMSDGDQTQSESSADYGTFAVVRR
jgi:hypothetical protein